ncbi:MAG: sigma-70 family RNA polymerase sigma factor [Actinobacteria bacterium]|nr:sigma-70 family RNA polymerase sigma factor [Actinomycetota bacterium]
MRSTLSSANETDVRALYNAHGGELYGFAFHALADDALAEEAVQETFLRAWRARHRFDPDIASARTWLFAIIRNVIVDLVRSRRSLILLEDPEAVSRPHEPMETALLGWQIEEALSRLSHDHREVLLHTYFRGSPYEEVALELGIPVGTVKSRVYYALRALKLALEEMGWEA